MGSSAVVMRRSKKPERLSEAELIALTGVSRRNLTRWRQQGLVLPEEPRHGLGQGHGTTPLEYPAVAVAIIKRIINCAEISRRLTNGGGGYGWKDTR